MSLSFLLPGAALPDTLGLERALPAGVRLSHAGARADILGRLVVPRASTVGVLVRWEAGRGVALDVRALASDADVAVAVEVAIRMARRDGLSIRAAGRSYSPSKLAETWGTSRCLRHIRQNERSIRDLARDSKIRVEGVTRPVVVGPRLNAEIASEPGALLDWLLRTQWLPGTEPLALPPVHLGGDPMAPTVARLEPGARVLLAPADLVELPGEPAQFLQHEDAVELLKPHAHYLDEAQLLVEVLAPERWSELRERAAALSIPDPATWQRKAPPRALLPELRPPAWRTVENAVSWPLGERGDGLPLVALVEEGGRDRAVVTWAELRGEALGAVRERALAELDKRLPEWEVERDRQGRVQALVLHDTYAAEALLLRRAMLSAHELLQADLLLAAIPVRGTLRVERARGRDVVASTSMLLEWAQSTWEDAVRDGASTALTPYLLVVSDAEVAGRADTALPSMSAADEGSIEMPGLAKAEETAPEAPLAPGTPFRGDNAAILGLALPALGSLAVEPAVALVDTAFVAGLGDASVGALGVAGAILSLAFVVFNFLAYGTTPLVAEARARGEREEAGRTVVAALILALAIGSIGACIVYVGAPVLVATMGAEAEVFDSAVTYLSIRAWGAPALLLLIAGHGAYRGFQDTVTPLVVSLAVAVLNVGLDGLFLVGWGWDIAGAAWASVLAQWVGAIAFLALLFGPNGHRRGVPRALPPLSDLARLLSVGSILSVRTLAVVGVMAFAASVATRLGETSIAGHQVVHQLWMAAALLADGLAVAAQALIAAAPTAAHRQAVTRRLLLWGLGTGVVLAVGLLAAQCVVPFVFRLSPQALVLATQAAIIAAILQPVAALVFVGDGLYLGAQRFGFAAWSMVVASVVGVLALVVLPSFMGLVGVWIALGIFVVARAVLLALGTLPRQREASDA